MRRLFWIVTLALPLTVVSWAQTKEESVKKALDDYVAANRVIGASVAIVSKDGASYSVGAGFQDREKGVAADAGTIYRLGSISKVVTAVAAMKMVEAGRLSLFSNVATVAPEWNNGKAGITLRHLLTHTSGIRHYIAGKPDVFFEPLTVAKALDVFKDDALLFAPGERVSYSTHAFSLVARMVEATSGEKFGDFIKSHISTASGSPTLGLEDRAVNNEHRSELYSAGVIGLPRLELVAENISWKSGGGGMESSAPDLARFGLAVLDNKLNGSHTTDFMFQRQVVGGLDTGRGLGWALDAKGNPEHGGAQQGCRTFMKIDKSTGTVFVVMTNTGGNHPIGQLLQGVIDAWYGVSVPTAVDRSAG